MSREESGEEGERIKGRERKGERAREDGRKAKEKKSTFDNISSYS